MRMILSLKNIYNKYWNITKVSLKVMVLSLYLIGLEHTHTRTMAIGINITITINMLCSYEVLFFFLITNREHDWESNQKLHLKWYNYYIIVVEPIMSNVVYSVSAPVSVWPLEWNISIPVNTGVPFRVYRKYIYIYN